MRFAEGFWKSPQPVTNLTISLGLRPETGRQSQILHVSAAPEFTSSRTRVRDWSGRLCLPVQKANCFHFEGVRVRASHAMPCHAILAYPVVTTYSAVATFSLSDLGSLFTYAQALSPLSSTIWCTTLTYFDLFFPTLFAVLSLHRKSQELFIETGRT